MKSNKQSKIKVRQSKFKRAKFNWNHDVNTTFGWGEIQPTQCKLLIPGSKTTMRTENLIRLAPMIAPTFGRVKYKSFNQFVSLGEIFPNFDAMMAQEPKSTAFGTKVPQALPSIQLGKLSAYVLMGARGTIYWTEGTSNTSRKNAADVGNYVTEYCTISNTGVKSYSTTANTYRTLLSSNSAFVAYGTPFNNYSDKKITGDSQNLLVYPRLLTGSAIALPYANDNSTYEQYFVLGNDSVSDWFPISRGADQAVVAKYYDDRQREVSLDSADYVIEFKITDSGNDYYFALALELSDYGKRIRKVLQGCGYQIDLQSTQKVSILPLLAQYKAYFDIFGLQLYQGWESTRCAQLIKWIENNFIEFLESSCAVLPCKAANGLGDNQKLFGNFMLSDLADEWYTDDVDFVSANLEKLAVSPLVDQTKFLSIDGTGLVTAHIGETTLDQAVNPDGIAGRQVDGAAINYVTNIPANTVGGHSFINNLIHGEVDAELLKRMYKWTNRNTVLGREIAKILRAQGLGDYVDSCKSNFIGSTDTLITISDVVSQAATQEAVLGEYGGRGLQYDSTGVLVFENDSYGYWITLSTIVPEAGYTQGLDPTVTSLDKFSLYEPDFDAIGMEATPKHTINGQRFISGYDGSTADNPDQTFGFIPRMSKFKVTQNLTNGDFNRHNLRNTYLPYTLDKQLLINDFSPNNEVYDTTGSFDKNSVNLGKTITNTNMPIAGNIWREPTKYQFLGNFDRIFYKTFDDGQSDHTNWNRYKPSQNLIGFSSYNNDNFLSHGIYEVSCYAPMKAIEESYGLEEDVPNEGGAEFVTKA